MSHPQAYPQIPQATSKLPSEVLNPKQNFYGEFEAFSKQIFDVKELCKGFILDSMDVNWLELL